MTVVFVHGVPEIGALWNRVRSHLDGDTLAVDLPGFGTPRPAGFGATKDEYAQWLADELRGLDGRSIWWGTTGERASCCAWSRRTTSRCAVGPLVLLGPVQQLTG